MRGRGTGFDFIAGRGVFIFMTSFEIGRFQPDATILF